ncbi:MAG: retroviral-like aspartic protease [Stigonema ocellatum SAG 48.90 = DSM 106950]|nr:retroviral-like aspartic protease [Stigonema ocellatum SAG 48.90 = DSM 106950]
MLDAQRFPFVERYDQFGIPDAAPLLPLTLTMRENSLQAMGLLDTGASINVLPYLMGMQLGAVWEQQTVSLQLAGNLAAIEARGLILDATVAQFPTVDLAFAWVKTDNVPMLLGQMNFFREFDVCFYRSSLAFEVRPTIKNLGF